MAIKPMDLILRVLVEVGGESLSSRQQFLFVDNVIAVKHRARLMAGEQHRDALGDARSDEVARGGAATVMEQPMRDPGFATRVP
jgi:hypothetical protein